MTLGDEEFYRKHADSLLRLSYALVGPSDAEDIFATAVVRVLGSKRWPELDGLVRQMQVVDTATYLVDDILTKVDRAAMAVSLETRVPFLNKELYEFAHRVPTSLHTAHNQPKHLLKRVLARHVPPELTDRPKSGFSVPIGDWLRGDLRQWANDLLDRDRLTAEG